jgi:hypothetical protein
MRTAVLVAPLLVLFGCSSSSSTSSPGGSGADAGGPPRTGDPCKSLVAIAQGEDAGVFRAEPQPGDIPWIETPEITHERDYYSYEDFVKPGAPTDWRAAGLVEGQIWLRVEVLSVPPDAELPIFYTVTWKPAREGAIEGFLRAAIEIDKKEPAVYDAVADVRAIEYSPDGTCCQQVCGKPWPWDAAWTSVAGDVVVLKGNGFPLKVKTKIVLRPAR